MEKLRAPDQKHLKLLFGLERLLREIIRELFSKRSGEGNYEEKFIAATLSRSNTKTQEWILNKEKALKEGNITSGIDVIDGLYFRDLRTVITSWFWGDFQKILGNDKSIKDALDYKLEFIASMRNRIAHSIPTREKDLAKLEVEIEDILTLFEKANALKLLELEPRSIINDQNSGQIRAIKTVQDIIQSSSKISAPVATVSGLIGDFLQPMASICWVLFGILFVVTIISGTIWFAKERIRLMIDFDKGEITEDEYNEVLIKNKWLMTFSFSGLSSLIVLLFSIGTTFYPNRGLLGNNLESLSQLQDSILKIEKSIERIEKNTIEISGKVDEVNEKLDKSLDLLNKALNSRSSNPIEDPKNAGDFLMNAMIYSDTGNISKSKENYIKYFEFNLKYIEPYNSYIALLKNSDGIESARSFTQKLSKSDDPFFQYISLQLETDWKIRLQKLEKLINKDKNFGPYYADVVHSGIQLQIEMNWKTKDDMSLFISESCRLRKIVLENHEKLKSSSEKGFYLRYYINKEKMSNFGLSEEEMMNLRNMISNGFSCKS